MSKPHAPRPGHGPGHETRDVRIGVVLWAAAGIGALALGTFVGMAALLERMALTEARSSPPASPLAESYAPKEPPPPRLQTDPLQDLETLRAEEESVLGSYGWADQAAGTVRIPIARAMEILAARAAPGAARTPETHPAAADAVAHTAAHGDALVDARGDAHGDAYAETRMTARSGTTAAGERPGWDDRP